MRLETKVRALLAVKAAVVIVGTVVGTWIAVYPIRWIGANYGWKGAWIALPFFVAICWLADCWLGKLGARRRPNL